jgi:hypothetical protein
MLAVQQLSTLVVVVVELVVAVATALHQTVYQLVVLVE